MNDFEIDKALARAIGHKENDIGVYGDGSIYIRMFDENDEYIGEKPFSHKDPAVILPIVKKYHLSIIYEHIFWYSTSNCSHEYDYETAVALAVIELAKEGKI